MMAITRAHAFLDLLEMGVKQGRSPEAMIVEIASTGDKILGKEFLKLAASIERGDSLERALAQTPGFLPEPVVAMLRVGEKVRDIPKVLPACRDVLVAGPSREMGSFNYFPVYPTLPALGAIMMFVAIIIIPKFNEIFHDLLQGQSTPASTQIFIHIARPSPFLYITLLALAALILREVLKSGKGFCFTAFKPIRDRFLFRLPWRRKRMQRDFSAMLAILLDAGMPEADAVALAAQSTANRIFTERARVVTERLQQGVKLTEAIRALDDTGEFQWRLANAAHTGTGFLRALQGWHDALEAKAFQQEQAASQAISTVFIVLNGALACLIALAIFQPMVQVIQEGTMW